MAHVRERISETFQPQKTVSRTGCAMEQLCGSNWTALVHPDDRVACQSAYSLALKERRGFRIECRIRRADGECRWVLCSGVPRFSPEETFRGHLGTSVDITPVKRAHEAAIAAQKLERLGTLARGIAHDFNNILSAVVAQADVEMAELAPGSSPYEAFSVICDVAMRGSEIVNSLMVYSGEETEVHELADLSEIVQKMLALLRISAKRVTLEVDLDKDLPAVRANAAQISQLVMNLVINASEAIGDREGTIQVTTRRVTPRTDSTVIDPLGKREYVQLEVSDTGPGMPMEMEAKVFDPFFTTKSSGHGLGLAVVQGIVRGHGGSIRLVSDIGKGTTFQILLPRAETTAEIFSAPSLQLRQFKSGIHFP